jgi:putative transposase
MLNDSSPKRNVEGVLRQADGQPHVKRLIPKAKPGGRPRTLKMREILNAVFYLVRGGIAWAMMPKDFPNYKSVYHYFRLWRIAGRWKAIHDRLRQRLRQSLGRQPSPSAAILDSQSVKTTAVGGDERGFDKAKQINGRKRHVLVDTLGLIITARVHSAARGEREGAKLVLAGLAKQMHRLRLIWADRGYTGPLIEWVWGLRQRRRIKLEIVLRKYKQEGFVVLPRRWVVERTFGWLGRSRRLSKDYERLPERPRSVLLMATFCCGRSSLPLVSRPAPACSRPACSCRFGRVHRPSPYWLITPNRCGPIPAGACGSFSRRSLG